MVVPFGQGARVVVYYRMSTDHQDQSIERQQSTVEPHVAANGYRVVEVCKDEGIAGNEILKRKGLQRVLSLAMTGKIDGIIVDDLDRLLRLDLLQLGELLAPLRRAGIWIESVTQGRFDYESMGGRVLLGVTSEGKHAQSVDTSWRVINQHLRLARDAGVPNLPPPGYGYRRVDDFTREKKTNGKYHGVLVIDDREAEVVRSIFNWYAKGYGLAWIVAELRRRAVVSPRGRPVWREDTMRDMLKNPLYIGNVVWGKYSYGKFHRFTGGKVVKGSGTRRQTRNPRDEWIVTNATVPAIIEDMDVWEKVQAKLAEGSEHRNYKAEKERKERAGRPTTPNADPSAFLLSQLLVCGQCGSRLSGFTRPTGSREPAYVCVGYVQYGTHQCFRCEVREQPVVDQLVSEIRSLLAPEKMDMLRQRLRKRIEEVASDKNIGVLEKLAKAEKAELTRLQSRLLKVSEDMIEDVEAAIRECRLRVEQSQADLDRAKNADPTRDLEAVLKKSEQAIWNMEKAIEEGDRLALKDSIRSLVSKIVVYPKTYQTTTGKDRRKPGRYAVTLKEGSGLEELSNLDVSSSRHVQVRQMYFDRIA